MRHKCLLLILGILAPCSSNPQNFAHSRPAWEGGTLMTYMMYQTLNRKWIQPVNACVWIVHSHNRYTLILRNRHHPVHCTLLHKKSSSTCVEYLHSSVSNRTSCWLGNICLFMLEMCSTAVLSSVFFFHVQAMWEDKGCPVSDFTADWYNSNMDFCFWYRTNMIGIGF